MRIRKVAYLSLKYVLIIRFNQEDKVYSQKRNVLLERVLADEDAAMKRAKERSLHGEPASSSLHITEF